MKKNNTYRKTVRLFLIFAILYAQGSDECDKTCEGRIELFITKYATPLINSMGSQLGITLPEIKGNLLRRITVFDSVLIFYSMFFGATSNNLTPIDSNAAAPLKMQTIKGNTKTLYYALTKANPSKIFMDYSFLPIGTHAQSGKITFENKSNNSWQICLLSPTKQTYETIGSGQTKSIETDLPQFYLYLDYPQKKQSLRSGSWLNTQISYNGESYTLKEEGNQTVLIDNSTQETINANKAIVINVMNTL